MKDIISKIIEFTKINIRIILILLFIIFIIFLSINFYFYYQKNNLKKISINFFNTIEQNDNDVLFRDLSKLNNNSDFYSVLSNLKTIEIYEKNKNYSLLIKAYKDLLENYNLDNLYMSAISSKAAYSVINIFLTEKNNKYIEEIEYFIENIDINLESYKSIKIELDYLLVVAKLNIKNINYSNNTEVNEIYKNIINSEKLPDSIKERVRKIHEFETYK